MSKIFPLRSRAAKLHILVVDDHYASRLIAQTLFEREGHRVTLAHDGHDALQVCQHHAFDLILMDIQMPNVDGPTAFKHLRSKAGINQSVPIYAVTSHDDDDKINEFKNIGFDRVIIKPITQCNIAPICDSMCPNARQNLNRLFV